MGPGWDLATIGDAGENTFIETSVLNASLADRSHFWIGATDAITEGTFLWVDGTPFVFTDWWSTEPNNLGNEDFLAFDLRGGSWAWNDASDGSASGLVRGYVAERVASVSVPESGGLLMVGYAAAGLACFRRLWGYRRRPRTQ